MYISRVCRVPEHVECYLSCDVDIALMHFLTGVVCKVHDGPQSGFVTVLEIQVPHYRIQYMMYTWY